MSSKEEFGAEINRVKRELARVEREERKKQKELRFLNKVINDIDRMHEMSWGEMMVFRSKLERLLEILKNDKESTPGEIAHAEHAIQLIDNLRVIRNKTENRMREAFRKFQIKQRRALDNNPAQEDDSNLCVVCHKRVKHFDDYCKRCVPPDQRPTGKVM